VPRIGLPEGKETLTRLTELSGGAIRTDVLELFRDPPRTARTISLLIPLMIAGILLLILEIAGRRLSLWEWLRDSASVKEQEPVVATATQQTASGPAGWLARWQTKRRDRKTSRPQPAQRKTTSASRDGAANKGGSGPAPKPQSQPEGDHEARRSVFEQAKKRAKRRLE